MTVGADATEPGQDLSGVSGARLIDGRLIIANSGTLELRVFDSAGAFERAEGRKGQGPGEFADRIHLFSARGDSLYSLDEGNLRWSLHTASGQFMRVIRGGVNALHRSTWLYHRTIVESSGPEPVPIWALAAMNGLPEPPASAPVRRARFDDLGLLWIDSSATGHWTIFADSGARVGQVTLPVGFRLLQAGRDFVMGVELDTLGQELVRVYRLRRPPALFPATGPTAELPPADTLAQPRMLSDLRQLLMAQEVFYSQHGSYAARADSLGATVKSGAELALLSGDTRHWAGILYDRASKTTCGISVGFPAPPGWIDGSPFCGR